MLYRYAVVAALYMGSQSLHAAEPKSSPVIARGENIAQLICANCHVVAPNQQVEPILEQPTPSFEEIANRPATTEKSLTTFLKTTHWDTRTIPITMPNPVLMADDRTAVIRYILSLRTKRDR